MELTGKRKLALVIFALTFMLMIYSVIPFSDLGITFLPTLGWYFTELSALFLVAGSCYRVCGTHEGTGADRWICTRCV